MIRDPREAYDRWMQRKPVALLTLLAFGVLFGLQVFAWSRGAGAQVAITRGLVAAIATDLVGFFFVRLVEADLRSRLEVSAPPVGTAGISGELVILPTPWRTFYYLTVPAIVVGVSVAFMWTSGSILGWAFVIFSLVFTVVFVAGAWLFVHNSRLVLTGDSLIKTNWRSATTRVPRGAIVRVVRLAYDRSGVSGRGRWITRYWIFVSSSDRALTLVNQAMWPIADLEILAGRLGVPVDGSWSEVLKPKEARRRVKGVVRWTTAHPWMVLIMSVVLSVVLIVLLIALLSPSG
jgi:hypothetical protein